MIYLTCEKTLIDKGYKPIYNDNIWCFLKRGDTTGGYTYLKYDNKGDVYIFSFPLKNGKSYVKYFNICNDMDKQELEKYVENIVLSYL